MNNALELSVQLNKSIKESDEYKSYQYCKNMLRGKPEKLERFMEFRKKNYEIQTNEMLDNPYDEVNNLFMEYDTIVHDTIVNDFIRSEQKLMKMMRKLYENIAEDLDFDIIEEEDIY